MRTKESDQLDEYDIIQNSVLGAHCIHSALINFEDQRNSTNKIEGMLLPISYLILPIVFSNEFSQKVSKKRFKLNSFYTSFFESGITYMDIHKNAKVMFNTTSRAISISCNSGLIELSESRSRLMVLRNTELRSVAKKELDYGSVIRASRRVGSWFGQMQDADILSLFNTNR